MLLRLLLTLSFASVAYADDAYNNLLLKKLNEARSKKGLSPAKLDHTNLAKPASKYNSTYSRAPEFLMDPNRSHFKPTMPEKERKNFQGTTAITNTSNIEKAADEVLADPKNKDLLFGDYKNFRIGISTRKKGNKISWAVAADTEPKDQEEKSPEKSPMKPPKEMVEDPNVVEQDIVYKKVPPPPKPEKKIVYIQEPEPKPEYRHDKDPLFNNYERHLLDGYKNSYPAIMSNDLKHLKDKLGRMERKDRIRLKKRMDKIKKKLDRMEQAMKQKKPQQELVSVKVEQTPQPPKQPQQPQIVPVPVVRPQPHIFPVPISRRRRHEEDCAELLLQFLCKLDGKELMTYSPTQGATKLNRPIRIPSEISSQIGKLASIAHEGNEPKKLVYVRSQSSDSSGIVLIEKLYNGSVKVKLLSPAAMMLHLRNNNKNVYMLDDEGTQGTSFRPSYSGIEDLFSGSGVAAY